MRHLGMYQHNHQYWLDLMNQSDYRLLGSDCYNEGPLVDLIEQRVADLLDKPAAMFFNKGTTCQLAAMKTVCEHKNNNHIAIHPQSHIAIDEQEAYQHLMGLEASFVGTVDKSIMASDLQAIKSIPAILVIELPLRRAGFKLADWSELLEIRHWCDEHQVHLHMDGARLWESAPFYDKPVTEIAALFDSVYISLYKGIGGLFGAVLAGEQNWIKSCQPWRQRVGSQLWSNFPALITGLEGLDRNLPLISQWVSRAADIQQALSAIDGLIVGTAQTNGFQVRLKGDLAAVNGQFETLKHSMNLNPGKAFARVSNSELLFTELQVGAEHHNIKTTELVAFFQALVNE
jgi:threonine aldolase